MMMNIIITNIKITADIAVCRFCRYKCWLGNTDTWIPRQKLEIFHHLIDFHSVHNYEF